MSSCSGTGAFARCLGVAMAVALAAAPQSAWAEGRSYTFTKLMVPGSTQTHATGINNAGLVVGSYKDGAGVTHGFSFDGVTYTTIDFPGSNEHYAIGVGPLGQIVGTHGPAPEGPWHAFIKDESGYTSFDFPGMESDARAMNSSGQIVGVYNAGGSSPIHGFLKTGSTFTSIDYPGAAHTRAEGLNDAGVISGAYSDATGVHGFVALGTTYLPVNYPGASLTHPVRLNNLNEVVGYQAQAGGTHGFVFKGSSFRGFDVDLPGATSTFPFANNDSGRVVGAYTSADCPDGCGFLAVPNTALAKCDQTVALSYANNTVNIAYSIKAAVPTTWTMTFRISGVDFPLWTLSLPAVPSTTAINLQIPGVPRLGVITALSTLSTAAGGNICGDYASVNTGL